MLFVESLPKRKERKYLPEDLSINTWQDLESFVNELLQRKIQNVEEFENWLVDVSEFEMITSEDYRWRYIKTSVNTNDNEAKNHLESFILHLSTHLDEFSNEISKKILASPFLDSLKDEGYKIYIRGLKKDVEIFRKQNVEIAQQLNLLVNEYDSITG